MLLAFPDPDVPRDICTDASNLQSGAAIKQKGNTMAFFSWKLSTARLKHPTIDEELLCIAQVLEECHSTSWSAGIEPPAVQWKLFAVPSQNGGKKAMSM